MQNLNRYHQETDRLYGQKHANICMTKMSGWFRYWQQLPAAMESIEVFAATFSSFLALT